MCGKRRVSSGWMRQAIKVLKEGWHKELAQIEQRRNDSLPVHEKMQTMSKILRSYGRTKLAQNRTKSEQASQEEATGQD